MSHRYGYRRLPEENRDIRVFFRDSLDPARLCEKLAAYFSTPIVPGETLLFLDEMQACPEALAALRFLHEKMPGLHVVGAGSLLEFALAEIPSLGVGRLSSFFMHPLAFDEFLLASTRGSLVSTCQATSRQGKWSLSTAAVWQRSSPGWN